MPSDYTPRKENKLPAFESPYPGFGGGLSDHEVRFIESYGHACAEEARAPLVEENARLIARIAELEALVEKESDHDAPLPPEYKVEEFFPGIWVWSVKGESEWVCDGAAYGWYEAAVVAAWRDHADTLTGALDESTAAEVSAIEDRDRLSAEVEALRAGIERALTRARVFDDGSDGADGESARSCVAILSALLAGPWVNPLAAELEKLRAASIIEWEPGRSYTAAELLRRSIRGITASNSRPLWTQVMHFFYVGSTVAHHLCRWAGRDPDTGKEIAAIAARKGEGSEG